MSTTTTKTTTTNTTTDIIARIGGRPCGIAARVSRPAAATRRDVRPPAAPEPRVGAPFLGALVILIVALLVAAMAVPAAAGDGLDDLIAATDARIAAIEALPAPTKPEKKEGKALTKASLALHAYQGIDDKPDLKQGLVRAAKSIRKSKTADAAVLAGLVDLHDLLNAIVADDRDDATTLAAKLTIDKQKAKVMKVVGKADGKRDKGELLWDTNPGKASGLLLKAILTYRKATKKALKLGATPGGSGIFPIDASALTLVLDPDGAPVPNAIVGGQKISDGNGVATGAVDVSAGGWVVVEAIGHADGYAAAVATLPESTFFTARLTPFASFALLDTGATAVLLAGDDLHVLEVDLDAAAFETLPVAVGLAEIDPLDVGPLFASVPGFDDHGLRRAFALTATETDGSPTGLATGAALEVLIRDDGALSDAPVLASFDPATGTWIVLPGACTRANASHLRATLTEQSALLALFEPGPGAYGASAEVPDPDLAFKLARLALARAIRDSAADPSTDPAVLNALDALVDAARALALASPDEHGKFALLVASGDAESLGQAALAATLRDEATDLAEQLATALLSADACGNVQELVAAAAQLDALDGDETLHGQLVAALAAIDGTCEKWFGTVSFFMPFDIFHPGLDDFIVVNGSSWTEHHQIVLDVDAAGNVTGTDRVQHSLSLAFYIDESQPCLNQIEFWGDPGGATLELSIQGTSPHDTVFSLQTPVHVGGTAPTIMQRWHFEDDDGDGHCIVLVDSSFAFLNHISLLVHGLYDATPVVSLNEMLQVVPVTGPGGLTTIIDYIEFENPIPDGGKYPFTYGVVYWSFARVAKAGS